MAFTRRRLAGHLLAGMAWAGAPVCLRAATAPASLAPLQLPTVRIELHLVDAPADLDGALLRDWVARSATVVSRYYGRFPVPALRMVLHIEAGRGVRTGRMRGGAMPRIDVWLGGDSRGQELRDDWVMVHEMVHCACPDLPPAHTWLEEGLAVYVESIARLQAGDLAPDFVWGEFAARMHHGLPRAGDQGLDRTPTWGRRYWGGALFCLLADLEIRRQTANRAGLREALRGVLAAGHDARGSAPVTEVLAAADRASGTAVLSELYDAMRHTPVDVDLDALWRRLGVVPAARGAPALARLDEQAPEAWLRRAVSGA